MRKTVATTVILFAASAASAQLVYEPFDYGTSANGTNLANLTGSPTFTGYTNPMDGQPWTDRNTNGTGEVTVASGNLTTTAGLNLPASVGSMVQMGRNSTLATLPIGQSISSGTIYYSMLFKVNDITSMLTGTSGAFFAAFNNSVATSTGVPTTWSDRLTIRKDGSGFDIGLASNATTVPVFASGTYTTSDTIFVVAGYDYTAGTNSLWINPTSLGTGTIPTPDVTVAQAASYVTASLHLRQITTDPTGIQVDEIRIDPTWGQVTAPAGSNFTGSTSTDWSNTGSWNAGGVPNAAASFAYFNGSGGTVNVNTNQTVGTLTFRSASSYTVGGTTLSLNAGSGGTSAINLEPATDASGVAIPVTHLISAPLNLANTVAIHTGVGQSLTISGDISGTGNVTMDGLGSIALTGNLSFTGNVAYNTSGNFILNGNANMNGGIASNLSGGTLTLSGTNGYTGSTTINGVGAAGNPLNLLLVSGDAALGAVPGTETTNIFLSKPASGLTLRFTGDTTLSATRDIGIAQTGGGNGPTLDAGGHNVTILGNIVLYSGGANLLTGGSSGTLAFRGEANTYGTLFINGSTANVIKDSNFGTGNIQMNGGLGVLQFGASFPWNSSRAISFGGSGGAIDTNGFDETITSTVSGAAPFTKKGAGNLTINIFNNTGSTTIAGGTLTLPQTAWAPILTNAGGAIINSGKLVFDYTGTSSPLSTVYPLLQSSYAASNFTSTGSRIRTTNTNDPNRGLGWIDDGASTLTIKYTYYGDLNLDGKIDADDYAMIDRQVALHGLGASGIWATGDVNYDGIVDVTDFMTMDTAFGSQTGILSPDFLAMRESEFGSGYVSQLVAAVPEPTSLGLIGLGAIGLVRRRRRVG